MDSITPAQGEIQPPSGLIAAYRKVQARNRELEQLIIWEDRLFSNPHLSASHKLVAREAVRVAREGKKRESDGLTYVNMEKLAEKAGTSTSTARRTLQFLADLGVMERSEEQVTNDNGERRTHIFIGVSDVLDKSPQKIIPEVPRNHGGTRPPNCPACGAALEVETIVKCKDCGLHYTVNTRGVTEHDVTLIDQFTELARLDRLTNHTGEQDASRSNEDEKTSHADSHDDQAETTDEQDATRSLEHPSGILAGNGFIKPITPPLPGNLADGALLSDCDGSAQQDPECETGGATLSSDSHDQVQASTTDQRRAIIAAAELLLDVAGLANEHIQMSKGEAKYFTVYRPLRLDVKPDVARQLDGAALARLRENTTVGHLLGATTLGALLWRPDGMTRALCFDEDDEAGWNVLKEAARQLESVGYRPLLEPSPVGRGGHLWILYQERVSVLAALWHVCIVAPRLQEIVEYWPRPGARPVGNKVRLPAGRYVRPGFSQWSKLYDARNQELAHDGRSAASILLAYQTPGAVIPPLAQEELEAFALGLAPMPVPVERATPRKKVDAAGPDSRWGAKYGEHGKKTMWFAWSDEQLIEWFNSRHHVRDILPAEHNGYGLASWRGERTASVGYLDEENVWVDFGAGARKADGKQDGGDALELQVRVSRQSKGDVLSQVGRDLKNAARAALESAASQGEEPPAWVQELLTDNGWSYYDYYRRTQAKRATKQQPEVEAAGENAAGQEVIPTQPVPQEITEESHGQRPPRGPDHVEVASTIFAYARRIGYPRLQIGDIVIEAARGWTGFVYSPKVTWEQRMAVYNYILATPDAGGEPSA